MAGPVNLDPVQLWQTLWAILSQAGQIFGVLSSSPWAAIIIGAFLAFAGKRVVEAIGLALIFYGVIFLLSNYFGFKLLP